eukprot:scpid94159/ scgid22320/ 
MAALRKRMMMVTSTERSTSRAAVTSTITTSTTTAAATTREMSDQFSDTSIPASSMLLRYYQAGADTTRHLSVRVRRKHLPKEDFFLTTHTLHSYTKSGPNK